MHVQPITFIGPQMDSGPHACLLRVSDREVFQQEKQNNSADILCQYLFIL